MGVREDPLSKRLLCAIPWVSPAARWAAYCHLYLAPLWQWRTYPLSGSRLSQPSWRDVVSLRTMLIDDTLAASDAPQLVILGAGFDSRALMPSSKAASKWKRRFEVDFPPTQAAKRAAVEAADLDASATTFVPCDFEHESWLEKLVQAGFDKSQRAVFVWEGARLSPSAPNCTPPSHLTGTFHVPLPNRPRHAYNYRRNLLLGAGRGRRDGRADQAVCAWLNSRL